jgi:hypothetical protein
MRKALILFVLLAHVPHVAADDGTIDEATIRAAVERSLPLLQAGAKSFRERSEGRCISCHHQGLVLPTVALARERGFAVDEALAREEVERVHDFYARRQSRYYAALGRAEFVREADPFGNFTVHAGYWLWALAAEKVPPDPFTVTAAQFLAKKQMDDGRWSFTDTARAPMQASDFTTTALAIFALRHYGVEEDGGATVYRLVAGFDWLRRTKVRTIDDKAFRLFGLAWSGLPAEERKPAAELLLLDQRADGGWAQQDNMPTDPYATGLALISLQRAGDLGASSASYQRGLAYLLKGQQSDGSWLVKTRAIPTNPYFESGFPHGKSQFISYAGTCWATLALISAVPERCGE